MNEIDATTIERARAGDDAATRSLIDALHRPIIGTIYRFLGNRYRHEVEDIAQDIFLKIFRSIDRFDATRGVKFTTWVFTFVRNHCFDIIKRRRLRTVSMSTERDGEVGEIEVEDPHATRPNLDVENTELGLKIEEALAGLGEDQRMAFVLREYEGLDYSSIAEVTGVSEGTVKSRLHRAKEALRQRLEPYLRAGA